MPVADPVPTLKDLIHELSAEYTMADQPVYVGVCDSSGDFAECLVTGISVRGGAQTLKYRWPDEPSPGTGPEQ